MKIKKILWFWETIFIAGIIIILVIMNIKSLNSQGKNDHLENEMTELEKQFKTKLDRAKQFISDCQGFQDIEDNTMITNAANELAYPDFDSEANYNKEFWDIYLKNQIILKVIKDVTEQTSHLQTFIKEIQGLQDGYLKLSRCKSRKKNRRLAVEIEKKHTCPYKECTKVYGSEVSLNLHIKLKHNGGNKTDRQKLAQEIIEAELSGRPIPQLTIQFPPGYLEAFRKFYKQNRTLSDPDA